MGISGNLQTMALADLFQWIADGSKTGTLRLDNGAVEKKLYFRDGRVVGTASTNPKEYLGHFLVSHGFITEVELAKALEMQADSHTLLGKILASIGVISEDDLERMLYLKSEESIYDLFAWTGGEFQFLDDELPEENFQPIDLNVTMVILQGTRRLDEWMRIREYIPSTSAVAVAVGDLESESPGDAAVLTAVNDDRTVSEIALQTHSSEFHVCTILLEQIAAGRLKMVRPRELAAPPAAVAADTLDSAGLLAEGQRRLGRRDFIGGLRHLRAARSLEPDGRDVRDALREAGERIRQALAEEGIQSSSVPRVSTAIDDPGKLEMSSDESFLLSRVNGSLTVDTILKISPMDRLEAQVALLRLCQAGYIELD